MIQSKANITSHFSADDIRFMQRALDLAAYGRGRVSPNPMVGCVITHNAKIIGEGWHRKYGEAHAEVNAINSVADKSLLPESTCYVTLEPCAHHGKTPPCADLLISMKVKRVVIAVVDSNPLVGGQGIDRMKAAGIQVETGCLQSEAWEQNIRFFTLIEKNRPYVILKWAQTGDGYIAHQNYDSKWISNTYSRSLVHQWRAEEDAILVGPGTALYDNPNLNVRSWVGANPIRIVIDRKLRLDNALQLFDGSIPTLIYNCQKTGNKENIEWIKLDEEQFLESLLQDLGERKIQSVIVEGGAAVLNAFINADLWDEARVFTSGMNFGTGIEAPRFSGQLIAESNITGDELKVYRNR